MRRIVVTGMGAVTPLGGDLNSSWNNLIKNKSGASLITKFDTDQYQAKVACEVPISNEHKAGEEFFNPNNWFSDKELRKVDDFIIFGVAAAEMAILDSSLSKSKIDPFRVGVGVGLVLVGFLALKELP